MNTLYPNYSVAIRTLGKAGEKYNEMLRSLERQIVKPQQILIYIPYGYELPPIIGSEKYIRCEKGMVTQRSLTFEEIKDEYVLFLDDDLYIPEDGVQKLFDALLANNGDCISPKVFLHHEIKGLAKWKTAFLSGFFPEKNETWAFRIRMSGRSSFSDNPREVMPTQAASFPCFLIKKSVFHAVHFEDERWIEKVSYTLGDDQLFYYKLHKYGYKLFLHFKTGIVHLDAQTGHTSDVVKSDWGAKFCRYMIWYRSIYEVQNTFLGKCNAIISYCFDQLREISIGLLYMVLRFKTYRVKNSFSAMWGGGKILSFRGV